MLLRRYNDEQNKPKEEMKVEETVVRQGEQEVEFAEEFTPQVEMTEDSEGKLKRKKKGE